MKLLPDQFWLPTRRGVYEGGLFNNGQSLREAAQLCGRSADKDGCLSVTLHQAKRAGLPEDRRLDVVLRQEMEKLAASLPLEPAVTAVTLDRCVPYYLRKFVVDRFFSDDAFMTLTTARNTLRQIHLARSEDLNLQVEAVTTRVQEKIAGLSKRYPLVWGEQDEDHLVRYIEMVDTSATLVAEEVVR